MALEIWDQFFQNIFEFAKSAFVNTEPWFYPFIFLGIIGFIYGASSSITVTIVAILITFSLFGGSVFVGVAELSQFLYILTVLGIALLIVTLFIKKR